MSIRHSTGEAMRPGLGWRLLIAALVSIILVFAVRRVAVDLPHLRAATVPEPGPDREYVLHPGLAYLHIALGIPFLLLAPVQLWRPFRERHYALHRRTGRTIVPLALVSGSAAIVFGVLFPVGGPAESAASLVFGTWFLVCLVRGWRAIRAGDDVTHRCWMIRAFAVAIAVGTIRLWIGLFSAVGMFDWYGRFAAGFWLSFLIHVTIAEWWVRSRPHPSSHGPVQTI